MVGKLTPLAPQWTMATHPGAPWMLPMLVAMATVTSTPAPLTQGLHQLHHHHTAAVSKVVVNPEKYIRLVGLGYSYFYEDNGVGSSVTIVWHHQASQVSAAASHTALEKVSLPWKYNRLVLVPVSWLATHLAQFGASLGFCVMSQGSLIPRDLVVMACLCK